MDFSRHHFVRVGAMGAVGRFTAVDNHQYPRGCRVICRTARGLELGEVLSGAAQGPAGQSGDGSILRRTTPQDELLLARQQKNRDAAFNACREKLASRAVDAALMDVEQLFDSATLYFYFLGDVSPEVEQVTAELAETYDAHVEFRKFAQAVAEGCGPECGTAEAPGACADGGCQTCAASAACGAKPR
ncbi:MAG: hypothetical protein KDA41_00400 [Planctomycetales bacterium]|nr:hypothetical protein [Planctomycetales bacterium]